MIARTHPEVPPVAVALGAGLDALPTGLVLLELADSELELMSLTGCC
jgi:hypothetical protein